VVSVGNFQRAKHSDHHRHMCSGGKWERYVLGRYLRHGAVVEYLRLLVSKMLQENSVIIKLLRFPSFRLTCRLFSSPNSSSKEQAAKTLECVYSSCKVLP